MLIKNRNSKCKNHNPKLSSNFLLTSASDPFFAFGGAKTVQKRVPAKKGCKKGSSSVYAYPCFCIKFWV